MAAARTGRPGAQPGSQVPQMPRRMQQRHGRASAPGAAEPASSSAARLQSTQTQPRNDDQGIPDVLPYARLGPSLSSSLDLTQLPSLRPDASALADEALLSDPMRGLAANSTLQSQVRATQAWRRDLKALLDNAQERFADVCWEVGVGEEDEQEAAADAMASSVGHGTITSSLATSLIWAHKAILYARATNMFQSRYLQLRDPAAQLGALAASSTISLPSIPYAASLNTSQDFYDAASSMAASKGKRKMVRGPAPPSSFPVSRLGQRVRSQQNMSRDTIGTSESGLTAAGSQARRLKGLRGRRTSAEPPQISYPITRSSRASYSPQVSQSSDIYQIQPSEEGKRSSEEDRDDTFSLASSQSTLHAPVRVRDVTPAFFQATLEYLYTAEESMVDIMEFLYEDRQVAGSDVEERLEKLRQDFVYMWRSRLYSDIEIIVGETDSIRSIPDAMGSVLSLPLTEVSEEEEMASFSAHRMILASRSPYFAAQLLSPYSDQDTRVIRLPSPPFTPAAMHFTLGFLYTGTLFFSNRTFDLSTAFQLWLASSYLQIETLQALVSSLITQDFCHSFSCAPPCKSCVKRIPKTLAFVSRPDVSDMRLRALAEGCISGEHFGSYWAKDVGSLSQGVRQGIVNKICDTIKEKPGFAIIALRQLAIVLSRVNVERSSRWVDSIRAMCESLHDTLCDTLVEHFADIVKTKEWADLVDGVGFNHDVLDKVLAMLVESLNERYAAKLYETLVGDVLLCEDHLPPASTANTIEEARRKMIQYLSKRWVNVRLAGGFNGLQMWTLKELGAELDVPYQDLMLSSAEMTTLARASTRLPLLSSSRGVNAPSTPESPFRRFKAPAPGMNIDGEREPGPIHLRASVLNRNAARVASGASVRSDTRSQKVETTTPPQTASDASASQVVAQLGSWTREDVDQTPRRRPGTSALPLLSPSKKASPTRNTVSEIRLLYEDREGQPSSSTKSTHSSDAAATASTTPKASPRAAQPARRPNTQTATSSNVAHVSQNTQSSSSSATVSRARRPSATSLHSQSRSRTTSVESAKTFQSTATLHDGSKSEPRRTERKPSTTTVNRPVKAATTVRRQASASSLRSERSTKSVKHASQATAVAESSARARTQPSRVPSVPSLPRGSASGASSRLPLRRKSDAKQTDNLATKTPKGSTTLALGIPCIAQPFDRNSGQQVQFLANVKYIGPVINESGQPEGLYIGLEVDTSQESNAESVQSLLTSFEVHDGTLRGQRYFYLGPPRAKGGAMTRAVSPERQVRRSQIAQMLGKQDADVPVSAASAHLPASKRRKEQQGNARPVEPTTPDEEANANLRGLFVRPQDIQSVLIS